MNVVLAERTPGTLPGYLSEAEAQKMVNEPFGLNRLLSVTEEASLLLLGWDREQIAEMTPLELQEHASHVEAVTDILLGS